MTPTTRETVSPAPATPAPSCCSAGKEATALPNADAPAGSISELLKAPERFALGLCGAGGNGSALFVKMLATGVVGFALFGFAVGFFASGNVALLDAAKGAGIALFAFALCFPSLYVFACIAGASLAFRQILTVGAACLAVAGLLLAALAPVLWLFAVSSASAPFVVILSFALAFLAMSFAMRPAKGLAKIGAIRSTAGLRVWFVIFAIVSLQTVTLLRPMLSQPAHDKHPVGKCFFLTHFFHVVLPND